MSVRWRAVYTDGTWLEEDHRPGGAYAGIDRSRLTRFEIYPDPLSLAPVLSVDVPEGATLLYCTRHPDARSPEFTVVVGVEREGLAECHFLRSTGFGWRQQGWGTGVEDSRPVLLAGEA